MHHEVESHAFFLSSLFLSRDGSPINGVSSRCFRTYFRDKSHGDNAPTFSLVRINALGRGGFVTWKKFFFALEFATESQLDEFFITHETFFFFLFFAQSRSPLRFERLDKQTRKRLKRCFVNVMLYKFIVNKKRSSSLKKK